MLAENSNFDSSHYHTITIRTLDDLQKISDKENFKLQTRDGKVYTYEELLEVFTNKDLKAILKLSPVEGSNIGEIGDHMIENAECMMQNIFRKNNILKAMKGLFLSPLEIMGRFIYTKVFTNHDISSKILSDGLYHLTSLENAEKIIASGHVKSANCFGSYGFKKAFFFTGEPSFEQVVMNFSDFQTKYVAVKIHAKEHQLAHLVYRKFLDQAVAHYGDFYFDSKNAEIVYLNLQEQSGKLVYQEITEKEFKTDKTDIASDKVSFLIKNLRNVLLSMSGEYNTFLNNINRFKKYIEEKDAIFKKDIEYIESLANEMLAEREMGKKLEMQKEFQGGEEIFCDANTDMYEKPKTL